MLDTDSALAVIRGQRAIPTQWRRRLLSVVAAICVGFLALTTVAMLVYPGGSFPITHTRGYQFFVNYFSDLGQTRTQSGASNYPSMLLFSTAVISVGLALAAFFVVFTSFVETHATEPKALRLNRIARRFGFVSAGGFVGLALIPENVFAAGHFLCVQAAFNGLLVAIILEIVTLLRTATISRWVLGVNAAFVVLLAAYIALMIFGPSSQTLLGDEINVVSQKIIVYVAISTIFAQSLVVRAHPLHPTEIVEVGIAA